MSKLNEKSHEGKRPSLDITSGMGLGNLLPPSFFLTAQPTGSPFGNQPWENTGKKSPLLSQFGGNYQPYAFDNEFPWQNPDVRKVLFPTRTAKLVDFLNTVGVNFVKNRNYENPDSEAAQAIRDQALTEWGVAAEQHSEAQTQADLAQADVKSLTGTIKSQNTALTKARGQEKDEIKRRGLKPLVKEIGELEASVTAKAKDVKKWEGFLKAVEKKLKNGELEPEEAAKKKLRYEEKLTPAKEALEAETQLWEQKKAELAKHMPSIQADGNQIEYRIGQLTADKEAKATELEQYTSDADFFGALEKDLGKIAKAKTITSEQVRDWAVHCYKKKIHSLGTDNLKDHDQVIGALLELFAEDADKSQIPEWLRFATLHFTGMTYESAHGTWVDPSNLLKIIEEQNIRDASPEELAGMMDKAKNDLTQQIAKAGADGDAKRVTALTKQLANLEQSAQIGSDPDALVPSAAKGDRRGLYQNLIEMETRRQELGQKLATGNGSKQDQAAFQALEAEIETFVSSNNIPASQHKNIQSQMAAQQEARLGALMNYSNQKIDLLGQAEVFGVLMSMKDEIQQVGRNEWGELEPGQPDIWKEIVAYTQLKNDEATGEGWPSAFPERYQLAKATSNDPQVQRWLNILDEWRSGTRHQTGITGWRNQFNKENEFVASSLVCNELAEHIQHLQGVKQRGGLNKNSVDYHRMGQAGGNAFFKHPTSKNDFKPGASLFWAEWSAKKPASANTVNIDALDGQKFYAPLTHDYLSSEAYKFAEFKSYRAKKMGDWKKEKEAERLEKLRTTNPKAKLGSDDKKTIAEAAKEQEAIWLAESKTEWERLKKEEHALHKPVPVPAIGGAAQMDGWKYYFEGNILTKEKEGVVLYLRWAHQSTIVEADEKRVRAYNTSGYSGQGMGISDQYSYGQLTANHNLFVGYAEGEGNPELAEDLVFEEGKYSSGMDLFKY